MLNQEVSEFLQNQIEFYLKDKNLSNLKFNFSSACNDGENFFGSLYRVRVNGEKNGENEELNLIVKCVPTDDELRELLRDRDIFLNEIAFYEERFPLIRNFLNEFNLQYHDCPTYYGGCKTPKKELLILEDLKPEGFVLKETKLLDYQHAVIAARHLGRFHAYSFALRDKKPKEFEILHKIKEPFFFESGCYTKNFDLLMEAAVKAVENEENHYVDKVKRLRENAQGIIDYACVGKNAEPYGVLLHGDLWTYNMLFKYNQKLEPEDVRFLDFQLNRYGSPAIDIHYMFYICLMQEMREKYYDEFLHHYHDSLAEMLKKLDCDVEKLFPFKALLEHLQRFGRYGACLFVRDICLATARPEDNPQPIYHLDFLRTLPMLLNTNKLYFEMLRDALKDMVDRNYL
ncbi:uncharacterized protein LOC122502247 isoform X1 [Leptopilina heterotoma]|uniref:uncharacterized protein LOC122502247 isoform X1 n=1 Tax=Leptopilina heterotoma TaxID=63436 RepID=UPI001CA92938|nr:uncharacterized protein LOC122502247 isoform X1 [Leptopilina heterotoma]